MRIAAELQSQSIRDPKVDAVLEQGWAVADEPIKEWLELHREALTIWRRGADMQRGLNLSPAEATYESQLPVIQGQRLFARLALLEEARCIHEGALDDAWGWVRAAHRSGGHASHRGAIMQGVVGIAIHGMSVTGMTRWGEQPALTSRQLKAALADVKADDALYESESNMLKAEYLTIRNSMRHLLWMQFLSDVDASTMTEQSSAGVAVMKMGYWIVGEPELSARIFRHVLANQIHEIDKPVARRRKQVGTGITMLFDPDPKVPQLPGQLDPDSIDWGLQRSHVARRLMPAIKQFDVWQLQKAGRQAAIEVTLAAQAYRRDHGEFPITPWQLVPGYLGSLPLDPCDRLGDALLYRRDDVLKAVVWSVGGDGVDSGGNVVAPKDAIPRDVGFELK